MMAHMQFDAKMREILKMDSELSKGPNWSKKTEHASNSLLVNENSFIGNKSGLSPRSCKTSLNASNIDVRKSPTNGISPGRSKSPGRVMTKLSVRAPGQKTPSRKTPNKHGDRFIPNRSTTDIDRAHHLLISSVEKNESKEEEPIKQKEYREKMTENLNDGATTSDRVLSFAAKAPQSNNSHLNSRKVLYSASKSSTKKCNATRHIPSEPEKVLDAPDLLIDYYLHLIDWSSNNHLAVALGYSVFLWNGNDGSITALAQFEEPDYVSSLSWIKEGNVLAIGLANHKTQLWDVSQNKLIRTMGGHEDRISSLAWREFILSSGSKSGTIIHHDVRIADHISSTVRNHTQEVCGLKWSLDGSLLASGGNDNLVNIWDHRSNSLLHSFSEHQAAVKGLAWCPWQRNFLASGGGTADRTIRLWNCSIGTCLNTVNTASQVSSLIWSPHYKELISGHGFSQNQLTLWKYPGFTKIVDLTGHTGRILEMCLSPDGQTVVSAAADETLRLWKCWAVDVVKKTNTESKHPISALGRSIR